MSLECTEMCKFMGKGLRENVPPARGSEEVGFTQFHTHKPTLPSISLNQLLRSVPPERTVSITSNEVDFIDFSE